MAQTALDVLTERLASLQAALKAEQDKLTALQSDPTYMYNKSRLDDPRVAANERAWISGDGTFWIGEDAKQGHSQGLAMVNQHNQKIHAQDQAVDDAEESVKKALADLANYEKTSPLAGQQIALQQTNAANEQSKTRNKTLVIVAVIIVVALIAVGTWLYFRRKKNKKETKETPAVAA